MSIEAAAILV